MPAAASTTAHSSASPRLAPTRTAVPGPSTLRPRGEIGCSARGTPLRARLHSVAHRPADLRAKGERPAVLAHTHETAQEFHREIVIPVVPDERRAGQAARELVRGKS